MEDDYPVVDDFWITVWLPLANPWFQDDALAQFGDFARTIETQLQQEDLGYFEGAMVGQTKVNFSFTLNPHGNADRAIAIVIDCLKKRKYETQAIVAHAGFIACNQVQSRFEKAVWPPDFSGELPR